ncbi:TrbG/VirB9 family P-type conjugative transfer protein [Burkholderia multivorans]|uniref:TrbG/VirB9 family P-type conjugative transfer protein n=1 Tax=Burkholderia multivorans TaxID=87883 RepID=A0AAP2HPF2_9BURK|nr:TrbG/VirB9 family P-type conjugative transfer protein [Burkholderia multivorans]MBU9360232.1 TrbG/VirB9 family P-type conjugative transfer protein [Burkholderia multivorans]MBU9368876.1 TrbG/VirB9 family P-type conjugative transfer protein [Burkholderia multivorans]HDR9017887.1 TrbG/VirB9 family P-type conjugative transfer protein [Burkholderia vietnamiensis]
MKHAINLLSSTVLVAGCLLQSACAESSPVAGPVYDFDWRLSGAAEVRPYQVFDDGQRVFLQFDDPKRVPAILADTPGGLVLLRWRPDPPYVVVDRMDPALVFRAGDWEARAVRTVPGGPPRMAQFGTARPSGDAPVTAPRQVNGAPARSINPPPDDR